MLLEKFTKFCGEKKEPEDNFHTFYQQESLGKSFTEMMADLGWQIYQLQVCIDGLIEDQEGIH